MGICEEKCDFTSYNYETKKAVCSCNIKTEIPLINDIKIKKNTLLNSFTDINNIANIQFLKCYKIVFQKKYILKNIGFYIYACLIILDLICLLFFINDYKLIIKEIGIIKNYFLNKNSIEKNQNIPNKKLKFNKNKSSSKKLINSISQKKGKNLAMINKLNNPPKYKVNKKNISHNNIGNKKKNNNSNYFKSNNIFIFKNATKHKKNNFEINTLVKLNHNEINDLSFYDALAKDNRYLFQYYSSLLKTKHSIIYIFYSEDYNLKTIKISIQIFDFATLISINALFFNDSTMHKIYVDQGSFNFIYQLPQIIYSTIISSVLNMLIQLLGLTEENILKFKNVKLPLRNLSQKYNKLIIVLKIKFIFFYILNFSFLLLFWYYVTCFCGMYRNTQIHLLKDSLISFISSLITPFGIYLIPGIFRIWALKRKSKILYGFSKLLQML